MALTDYLPNAKTAYASEIASAQDQSLTDFGTTLYNGGLADQKAADGTQTSPADAATIAALQGQVTTLTSQLQAVQAQDATDQANLQAATANVTSLQQQLAAMTAQDQSDKALVANFQNSLASLQSSLDAIKAALTAVLTPTPAPVPAPTPAPAPAT